MRKRVYKNYDPSEPYISPFKHGGTVKKKKTNKKKLLSNTKDALPLSAKTMLSIKKGKK